MIKKIKKKERKKIKKENIRIRKTRADDIDSIYRIKQEQFLNPWKKDFFYDEISHEISCFYVAEDTETNEIIGYIIFWIIEETLELHDMAVIEKHKKKGIGSFMMNVMLETARTRKVEELFLEVRKSNEEAIKFYKKFNFKQIGIRKNYYQNPIEDALVFKLLCHSSTISGNRVP
jgi:ribosomal-protein-alanine N-acetyltransferase